MIEVDATLGVLHVHVSEAQLALRSAAPAPTHTAQGYGLQLFAAQRRWVGPADQGASFLLED